MAVRLGKHLARFAERHLRFKLFRRFARHQDGSAAIEFGVVIIPFLAILFAIIETAMVFFVGQTMETAIADTARLVMTGQAQSQGFDKAKFQQEICTRLHGMIDCGKMAVAVQTYANFGNAQQDVNVNDPSTLVDANGNFKAFPYNHGCAGDIVVARAMYQWPVTISLLGLNLADMAGSKRLVMATAAFRNEPFQTC